MNWAGTEVAAAVAQQPWGVWLSGLYSLFLRRSDRMWFKCWDKQRVEGENTFPQDSEKSLTVSGKSSGSSHSHRLQTRSAFSLPLTKCAAQHNNTSNCPHLGKVSQMCSRLERSPRSRVSGSSFIKPPQNGPHPPSRCCRAPLRQAGNNELQPTPFK